MELYPSGDRLVAKLAGELDHHTARDAREHIDAAAARMHPRVLELDFGGVSFMDSSGVGLIMGRYRLMQALDGRLEVTHATPRVEKMMRLAGVSLLNVICPDSPSAASSDPAANACPPKVHENLSEEHQYKEKDGENK